MGVVMKFHIEMSRKGPDTTVLVTLCDGELPELGVALHDETGRLWRVVQHLESEVALQPSRPGQDPPKSLVIPGDFKRVHAA